MNYDRFREPDLDPEWGREESEGRYDYESMTNRELAARVRQYRRQTGLYSCEFGHGDCGCTNVASMSGKAPCYQRVAAEIERRKLSDEK